MCCASSPLNCAGNVSRPDKRVSTTANWLLRNCSRKSCPPTGMAACVSEPDAESHTGYPRRTMPLHGGCAFQTSSNSPCRGPSP
eukprot:2530611-Amphidinium_carterae.1